MREKLLDILRCPDCKQTLELTTLNHSDNEILEGVLSCRDSHFFPIVGGIPRMLPSSMKDHWAQIEALLPDAPPPPIKKLLENKKSLEEFRRYDTRTKANFSNEWDNHEIGGKTWTMDLTDRIKWFFLDPIKIEKSELKGKRMLDAGCGNGSQSVAYTEFGLEVVALDLSTGLEKGEAFRKKYPKARAENVHFVQGDLQRPPFAPDSFDIIHSAGVLHHTPDTKRTFDALMPLIRKDGTFYVWLYKYEKIVTPIVNTMRAVTTKIPAPGFAKLADLMALPFIGFCWTVDKLGIRTYNTPTRKESALAIHDIFGAPYAHYHSYEEVEGWFKAEGCKEIWGCNDDRRGFGVCARMPAEKGQDSFSAAKV